MSGSASALPFAAAATAFPPSPPSEGGGGGAAAVSVAGGVGAFSAVLDFSALALALAAFSASALAFFSAASFFSSSTLAWMRSSISEGPSLGAPVPKMEAFLDGAVAAGDVASELSEEAGVVVDAAPGA